MTISVLGPFSVVSVVTRVVDVCASMIVSMKEVVFVSILVFLGVIACFVFICVLEVPLDVIESFVDFGLSVVKDVLPSLYGVCLAFRDFAVATTENKTMIFSTCSFFFKRNILNSENVC